jgi:hypothetical protein
MSVHPARRVPNSPVVAPPAVVAADLLKNGATHHSGEINTSHPLSGAFLAFLGDKTPTKRQAAAFLAKYPKLRLAAKAA